MSRREHASSFMLPIFVLILIPALILLSGFDLRWTTNLSVFLQIVVLLTGFALILLGLYVLVRTIRLFATIGEGTLAPWAPTQSLVVTDLYQYVRNPMITGVLAVLLGEALIFSSFMILGWFALFFLGNHLYFITSEEPGLVRRFGDEYLHYAENVPRWIPRRMPWKKPT